MFAAGKTTSGLAAQTYVDDVFSTYLYTGNGSTQTITNGIDLAGKGGLVWVKSRVANPHVLVDTVRGQRYTLDTAQTAGNADPVSGNFITYQSNGFQFTTSNANWNSSGGGPYVAWTFRKAAKFFDVVTYTGNGSNRTIAHSLGQVPGMIVVKRTDTTADWQVYHRSLSNTEYLVLNTTAAKATGTTRWNSTTATATDFSLGTDTTVNANTGTYVAYLFAHDTASDGLIQCGSFTTDASGNATVTLGWEPQFVLWKASSTTDDWRMHDVMRGFAVNGVTDALLLAYLSNAENTSFDRGGPTATGFTVQGSQASATNIYLAIRRPNKPPTSGTQVFYTQTASVNLAGNTLNAVTTSFPVDLGIAKSRSNSSGTNFSPTWLTRLTGALLYSGATSQEATTTPSGDALSANTRFASNTQVTLVPSISADNLSHGTWNFRRALGVFDVVCYTGTGSATTVAHNLGVVPELMIVKNRSDATGRAWAVYAGDATDYLVLNTTAATVDDIAYWNDTAPTSSVFTVGTSNSTNESSDTFVAYLFATKAGISKVFSYTGNGSNQTINCGFTGGARFVLIKRTDSTGDWYVWDSTRGIVSGNDPHLSLNTTAAEVTTDDSVDADSTGFIVNQLAATNINVTSATYIGLAFA